MVAHKHNHTMLLITHTHTRSASLSSLLALAVRVQGHWRRKDSRTDLPITYTHNFPYKYTFLVAHIAVTSSLSSPIYLLTLPLLPPLSQSLSLWFFSLLHFISFFFFSFRFHSSHTKHTHRHTHKFIIYEVHTNTHPLTHSLTYTTLTVLHTENLFSCISPSFENHDNEI